MIGGYRIIRKLGAGNRSEVFLGHADSVPPGPSPQAAIKVFHASASPASVEAEIGALSAIQHPHIVRLVDLAAGDARYPHLIMERLAAGGLTGLLAERLTMSAGEAVTILAPIAAAVSDMHEAGVCHGAIGPLNVLFDELGAPVLIGFGAASRIGLVRPVDTGPVVSVENAAADPETADWRSERAVPRAIVESDDGVQRDLAALLMLAQIVLARLAPRREVLALLEWLDGLLLEWIDPGITSILAARLFELAEPQPVSFEPREVGQAELTMRAGWQGMISLSTPQRPPEQQRRVMSPREQASTSAPVQQTVVQRLLSWSERTALKRWISGHGGPAMDAVRSRVTGAVGSLSKVRRRVWLVAACGLAALLLAVLLASMGTDTAKIERGAEQTIDAESGQAALADRADEPEWGPQDAQLAAITGDDPVAALRALVERRERCFAELSVLCLESVDQVDGAAFAADAAVIRSLRDGDARAVGEPTLEGVVAARSFTGEIQFLERLGDLAMLSIGLTAGGVDSGFGAGEQDAAAPDAAEMKPIEAEKAAAEKATASVLIIRTEAGWRIRSLSEAT